MHPDELRRMREDPGFIAALDQSGGSTPKTLALYGVPESAYATQQEMSDLVHAMRVRVMTAPSFSSQRVLGAILFAQTLDREVNGLPTVQYLRSKGIAAFVKVDEGLEAEADGVRLMRSMSQLDALLSRATEQGAFGTKMRSVILGAHDVGIARVVEQQFEYAARIASRGLVPIIEPEVDLHCSERARAEQLLKTRLLAALADWPAQQPLMLKLTIPAVDNLYDDLVDHDKVLRVVALSGGYSQAEACLHLARNRGLIASFSRALLEGLRVEQSDEEFAAMLALSIERIYAASTEKVRDA